MNLFFVIISYTPVIEGGFRCIIFNTMSGVGTITFDAMIPFVSFLPNENNTQYAEYDGMATAAEQHWQEEQPFQINL